MDESYDWEKERRQARRENGIGDRGGSTHRPGSRRQTDQTSGEWDAKPGTERWLALGYAGPKPLGDKYRIDGWLAERGTSVWFGSGSTGKTQLMLWMAAMIASERADRHEHVWLGGRVNGTGHVLILTAEDTLEQITLRLRDIVEHTLGQRGEAFERTLSRLHVMPFLSMSEEEFDYPSASLLEQDNERVWRPTPVMRGIRRFVTEWNRTHTAEDDRIVGVVMDSATSMAGFDSLDAQATTNFFFYLGRLCEILGIFWAVIGHTPKVTSYPKGSYRATAASRLRGVAMWTTAPRLTVEVRLAQDWKERGGTRPEAEGLRKILGNRVRKEDLLVVYVAKANLKGAYRDERFLARASRGSFVDVTEDAEEIVRSGVLDPEALDEQGNAAFIGPNTAGLIEDLPDDVGEPRKARARSKPRGRPRLDPRDLGSGTDYVLEVVREIHAANGTRRRVSANRVMKMISARRATEPRALLVTSAHGGRKVDARVGSINWHLDRLSETGKLRKDGRFHHLPD